MIRWLAERDTPSNSTDNEETGVDDDYDFYLDVVLAVVGLALVLAILCVIYQRCKPATQTWQSVQLEDTGNLSNPLAHSWTDQAGVVRCDSDGDMFALGLSDDDEETRDEQRPSQVVSVSVKPILSPGSKTEHLKKHGIQAASAPMSLGATKKPKVESPPPRRKIVSIMPSVSSVSMNMGEEMLEARPNPMDFTFEMKDMSHKPKGDYRPSPSNESHPAATSYENLDLDLDKFDDKFTEEHGTVDADAVDALSAALGNGESIGEEDEDLKLIAELEAMHLEDGS